MPIDYTYDVFISYRHETPVLEWVLEHFYYLLKAWLPQYMPVDHKPRIFIDTQIETGFQWSIKLQNELKRSRCLISVWSPVYFQSDWCKARQYKDMSEWAISSPAFKETKLYVDFEFEMKNLCKELAEMIKKAPPWQEDWPIVMPSPSPSIIPELPRLR